MKIIEHQTFRSIGKGVNRTDDMVRVTVDMTTNEFKRFKRDVVEQLQVNAIPLETTMLEMIDKVEKNQRARVMKEEDERNQQIQCPRFGNTLTEPPCKISVVDCAYVPYCKSHMNHQPHDTKAAEELFKKPRVKPEDMIPPRTFTVNQREEVPIERKEMRYKLVFEEIAYFDDKVNKLLEEGWTLYGSPFTRHETLSDICQAMIKEEIVK